MLSLLAELAEDSPLLCLIDDAHWLDGPSSDALTFAVRRLDADGIAIIFAARDHDTPFNASGLSVLRIGGLDPASAAALLDEHGDGLTPAARSQILAEAGLMDPTRSCARSSSGPARCGHGLACAITGRLTHAQPMPAGETAGLLPALFLVDRL